MAGVSALLAALPAHGAAVASANLVGLAGLHVFLERLRLRLKLIDGLLLLRHRGLHLVQHGHLLLLKLLDCNLSRSFGSLVLLLLVDIGICRGRVVFVTVLASLAVLLLALVVHVGGVLQLLEVVGLLLVLEHVVVGVEEIIEVVS